MLSSLRYRCSLIARTQAYKDHWRASYLVITRRCRLMQTNPAPSTIHSEATIRRQGR